MLVFDDKHGSSRPDSFAGHARKTSQKNSHTNSQTNLQKTRTRKRIHQIRTHEWIHKNNYSFNASNKELLAAKYTFTILRNPFKRLLSFYCDKLCNKGISTNDRSYEVAKSSMGTDAKTTFSDFIEILWRNPSLKRANEHIQDQCDFLVYKNYHDYLALENYQETQSTIREKTGLIMEDVRQFNSIHTSYGCEDSLQIDYNSPA